MTALHYIKSYCSIKNNKISYNGDMVFEDQSEDFLTFIKSAYRSCDTNYPKFFKMDNLTKLAFLSADILLKNEKLNIEEDNNIALVLSNRASSLQTDRKHQESIQDKDNYYPSPAVFVYTLPNICLGEISIKYKLYTENSFFIFDDFNAEQLFTYSNSLLSDNKADQVLCGWVEVDENSYNAFLYLVSKTGTIPHTKENILTLYNT